MVKSGQNQLFRSRISILGQAPGHIVFFAADDECGGTVVICSHDHSPNEPSDFPHAGR